MKALLAAAVALLAAPGLARGADASLAVREVPLHGARALAAAQSPGRFDLVGLHWRGTGSVSFRTRGLSGRWSPWQSAAPEAEDGPDPGTAEAARARGWKLGNPWWTGGATRIEYRAGGGVTRLRAYFVRSSALGVPPRTLSVASSPAIVPRLGWKANEKIRRAAPVYAPSVRVALVHHTAGSNSYSRSQSAAIVRAIEVYHVRGNGWNDIGYNFLVDKYGQVFEGRYGGMQRAVVGAHAQGFNTGSVGVALLGSYGSSAPSAAALRSLESLLAWRLDLAHVDPRSTLTYLSGGNPRFAAGVPVFLRAISGHRDTGFTSCPGGVLYARLPAVARVTAATGLPKLYAPSVRGAVPGLVRFRARLSTPLAWTVTVTDSLGAVVGTGAGLSASVDWTWDARALVPGRFAWRIAAGPTLRSASGTIGAGPKPPPLRITEASVYPPAISPNGDGVDDAATVAYTLSLPATVTATLTDAAGTPLATLFTEPKPLGRQSFVFTADTIPDGLYRIVLTAEAASGARVEATVEVVVARGPPPNPP
jgi:N-acetylmuramoyl-L-alanine amidase